MSHIQIMKKGLTKSMSNEPNIITDGTPQVGDYVVDPTTLSPQDVVKRFRIGDYDVILNSYYPYRYNYGEGKQVLRFEVSELNHSFEELKKIFEDPNMSDEIQYLEGDEVKEIRKGYTRDFQSEYRNRMFSCEITRVTETERKVANLEQKLTDQQLANDMAIAEIVGLVSEAMTASV